MSEYKRNSFKYPKKDKKDAGKLDDFRREIGKDMLGKNKNVKTFSEKDRILLRIFFH
jgi:hypothetical protein